MTIHEAIELINDGQDLAVSDKTIEVNSVETLKLETGEITYMVEDSTQGVVLFLDSGSEEILLFQKLEDEDIDPNQDVQTYGGLDYDFSESGEAVILDDDLETELERIIFRDFEANGGARMRMIEYIGTGEMVYLAGEVVAEEELQEAA